MRTFPVRGRAKRPVTAARRPYVELLEERCLLDTGFRSITGFGNNVANPTWGSANVALLRITAPAYADGIDDPVVGSPTRPSPRVVSNQIVAQTTPERVLSDRLMSAMIYGWGQFLDHDLDLTTNASRSDPANIFDIQVPKGDPTFDFFGTGTVVIPFTRSKAVPGTGTSTSNPRQQPNEITAFVDASMVYGSSDAVARALRTVVNNGPDGLFGTDDDVLGATLKTSPGNLLPFNNLTYFSQAQLNALHMGNDTHAIPDSELFAAGDIRANENIELTSLHTLFVREHNRLAGLIAAANPTMSAEDVYQRARAIVGAELQVITYNQWIPTLLGPNALSAYNGYDPTVNPGIANEFSTALFRLGHSMLGDDVEFLGPDGREVADAIPLHDAFTNPAKVSATGIGPILKYLASDPSSEVDQTIVDEVRNLLFEVPGGQVGFDLASLNIQRGRDHGLPDYNTVRAALGLPRVTSFDQITSNTALRNALKQVYGNVDNIDLWIGGLSEDHVPGTSTGPLIRAMLINQFTRTRDGDRFWYQNQTIYVPTGALPGGASSLGDVTLADVIATNTDNPNLQDNVFFFRVGISGSVFNDLNGNGVRDAGEGALAGRVIQVEDADTGEVLLSKFTDGNGNFSFTVFDGLGTGRFNVRVVPPSGWDVTTGNNPFPVTITGGEQFFTVVFGNVKHVRDGSPQLALTSSPRAGAAGVQPLTQEMLQPIVAEAIARWQEAGVAPEVVMGLTRVNVQVGDLPGDLLGWWSAPEGITIDINADGYGWFVDPTPADDAEFPAAAGSPAYGRMDLLTVVAHELGHQLGLPSIHADVGLMGETLPSGVRRVPTPGDVEAAVALGLSEPGAASGQTSLNVAAALSPASPGEDVALGLSVPSVAVSGPSLTTAAVLSPANPVSPAASATGRPDLGVSAEVAIVLTSMPKETSLTPEAVAFGSQDPPAPSLSPPPPTITGEGGAFTLVADEGRRRALTTPVVDQPFTTGEAGLLTEDLFAGPVAVLRPPQ
jgi:peroxidase